MSVSKAYHIISSESIAVSCERLRPGRVETVYKSPANCLLFMTHVQQKLAGRSVVLAAPGRLTCSGGRKIPMYCAAYSGQHHARAQSSPVQDPLGAPEYPGATWPRTQLFTVVVDRREAELACLLQDPGRSTCYGGRKPPIHRAASSKQHHARA